MVIQASGIFLPSPNNQEIVDVYQDLELKSLAEEEYTAFIKEDSPQKEKQILVDPMSLRESSSRDDEFDLMLLPIVPVPELPPDLPPVKPQLISCSLPSSASSSPRFAFKLLKKKLKNENQSSPRIEDLTYQQSAANSYLSPQQEIHLQRSKSCAEGRSCAPVDELDIWLNKPTALECNSKYNPNNVKAHATKEDYYTKTSKKMFNDNQEFKCGALCLYLPGFGKAKPMRPKKEELESEPGNVVISRTVSLEKFECGSWASSAIMDDHEDDSMNRYFDLPLELIRTSVNEATSPVAAAFLFDKDHKNVLKNISTTKAMPRKSHESSRHVRFSTSSPTSYPASPASCITPRLRKAREEFNAFLEAQSA
ncbi:hypothetical protein K2173_004142 [Erythroxylum novogranatense]|uniref:Uncharacterized protein n=1 Tax=Erythroxylum novogranatense TaxID=1862640 RepID=A0AAV8SYQ7_9ROSI|nr:hypothetical protein K2173_004142 [Erythroxylum novogranatense]